MKRRVSAPEAVLLLLLTRYSTKCSSLAAIITAIIIVLSTTIMVNALDSCWDAFDSRLRQQCGNGTWLQRYYFDASAGQCRLFWWDGCWSGTSRNFFTDLLNCQWLCEQDDAPPSALSHHVHRQHHSRPQLADACYDKFDEHYRDDCQNGAWRVYYYFDKFSLKCKRFWYDNCPGESANLFAEESACIRVCEQPALQLSYFNQKQTASTAATTLTLWKQKFSSKHTTVNSSTIIGTANTLKTTAAKTMPKTTKRTFILTEEELQKESEDVVKEIPIPNSDVMPKTTNQYIEQKEKDSNISNTGSIKPTRTPSFAIKKYNNSSKASDENHERANFVKGPCTPSACKNGGSCELRKSLTLSNVKSDIWHECFCTKSYAGKSCDLRPCDENPCRNNGTCRTTRGQPPYYFCVCQSNWSGKNCVIPILSNKARKYGNNVQLISSGRPEWIEQIRRISAMNATQRDNETIIKDNELRRSEGSSSHGSDVPKNGFFPIHVEESPTRTLSHDPITATNGVDAIHGGWGHKVASLLLICIVIKRVETLISDRRMILKLYMCFTI